MIKSTRINKPAIREKNLRRTFMKILSKIPVSHVRFSGSRVSLTYFGHRISDYINIKHEDHVGEWSRKRREIFIDKNITAKDREKSFKAICVHEVIEKFLTEKFGLHVDKEAHLVASQKEKEYLKSIGGNWRSHELIVFWDWHRQGEH